MPKSNPDNYAKITEEDANKVLSRCVEDENGCLLWTGAKTSHGYGNIRLHTNGKTRYLVAHRVVFIFYSTDTIPAYAEIDHLCRNRLCCNKDHLEAVTTKTNTLRGKSFAALNKAKETCKWGHEFNEANTWTSPDGKRRRCRACDKRRRLERKEIRNAQKAPD